MACLMLLVVGLSHQDGGLSARSNPDLKLLKKQGKYFQTSSIMDILLANQNSFNAQ